MKEDPLRAQLLKELRTLRRGEGALATDQLAGCEALIRVVGMGSVEQLRGTLFEVFARYASNEDGDVRAYLETSGIGIGGHSLNHRLDIYAAYHHVDRRTGLRRSDRGAEALATLFRDETVFFRPWGHLSLVQARSQAFIAIAIHMDPESEYREPAVWVNEERLEQVDFAFAAPSASTGYVRAVHHVDDIALLDGAPWLLKVNVEWRMGVWPQWVLSAQVANSQLAVKLQTQRNFMTEATLINVAEA